jgi:hypothetical protein
MARPYWILMVREDGQWHGPEFGDYSQKVVQEERQDWKDRGTRAKDLAICKCESGSQAAVDRKVEEFRQRNSVAA